MVRIGFIGVGGIAGVHLDALSGLPEAQIVSAYDVDAARAQKAAENYGAAAVSSLEALLASDIDAVFICTPPFVHEEQIIASARAGKHIFCEKPFTLSLDSAARIKEAIDQTGVKIMIGHVLHFFPVFRHFKEVVDSGDLGDMLVCWCNRMGMGPGPGHPWMFDVQKSGGMTLEFNTHDVDWLRWMGGKVTQVYGKNPKSDPTREFEDNAWAILDFPQGIGVLGSSWHAALGRSSIGVIGTKGMIVQDPDGAVQKKLIGSDETEIWPVPQRAPFIEEDGHFLDYIQGEAETLLPFEDAIESLKICLAIKESARTGEAIALFDPPD